MIYSMTSKSRWLVFLVSTPLVILVSVGGLLSAKIPLPPDQAFTHLRDDADRQLGRRAFLRQVLSWVVSR